MINKVIQCDCLEVMR